MANNKSIGRDYQVTQPEAIQRIVWLYSKTDWMVCAEHVTNCVDHGEQPEDEHLNEILFVLAAFFGEMLVSRTLESREQGRKAPWIPAVSKFNDAMCIRNFYHSRGYFAGQLVAAMIEQGEKPRKKDVQSFCNCLERHLGGAIVPAAITLVLDRDDNLRRQCGIPSDDTARKMALSGLPITSPIGATLMSVFHGLKRLITGLDVDDWIQGSLTMLRKWTGMEDGVQYVLRQPPKPNGEPRPVFCPACGEHHEHGATDGYLNPHCKRRHIRNSVGTYRVVSLPPLSESD